MATELQMNKIVALDIGTNKVAAIIANVNERDELEIIGIGTHQSRGLKKGVVVNIDSTVQSIQRAIEEAQLMAGCSVESVYAGIAGSHIRSLNSHGIVAIRDREVFSQDIDRVIDAAKAMAIPADQKILHVLPQEFIIDTYQIVEAKAYGADVILLIAAILSRKEIEHYSVLAQSLGMEVLLEVHNQEELDKSIMPSLNMIGVNNRNLKTFEVSLERAKL